MYHQLSTWLRTFLHSSCLQDLYKYELWIYRLQYTQPFILQCLLARLRTPNRDQWWQPRWARLANQVMMFLLDTLSTAERNPRHPHKGNPSIWTIFWAVTATITHSQLHRVAVLKYWHLWLKKQTAVSTTQPSPLYQTPGLQRIPVISMKDLQITLSVENAGRCISILDS